MKSQGARERQAVVIGTALAIFVMLLLAGALALAAYRAVTGRDVGWAAMWLAAAAALLAGRYVARHRR